MAMLAEKKRKQKWTLNPRGKYWSEDVNKFGQKMLEKMGWSSGKGLGANEDGITDHVKVQFKNDSLGIGFKDKGDQWTKHETAFSSLLQNLTEDKSQTEIKKPETSLEVKSQSSRARVHYHKFTRGKDLSRYSEKDLANIFGRKTLQAPTTPVVEENSNSNESDKNFGVVTIQSGNMTDYFQSKMQKLGCSFAANDKDEDSDSDCERTAGFGFTTVQIESTGPVTDETPQTNKPSGMKSLYSGFIKAETNPFNDNLITPNKNPMQTDNCLEESQVKKRNKSRNNSLDDINEIKVDVEEIKIKKKKSKNGDIEIETPKTKKQKSNGIDNFAANTLNKEEMIEINMKVQEKKKKAKEINNIGLNLNDNLDGCEIKRKKKKCKLDDEKKQKNIGFDNLALNLTDSVEDENDAEMSTKIKKRTNNIMEVSDCPSKKKKSKIQDNCYDNPCLESIPNEKKSSKKKKCNMGFDNPALEINDFAESPGLTETKSKKTKRKFLDVVTEDVNEHTPKSKKTKSDMGLDNPGFSSPGLTLQPESSLYKIEVKRSKKSNLDVIPEETDESNVQINEKKKKKSKKNLESMETVETIELEESPQEVKQKKKKKRELNGLNGVESAVFYDKDETEVTERVEKKVKKKKNRTSVVDTNGIDNPGCTANSVAQDIEETIASMTNAIDNYQNEVENQINEGKDVRPQEMLDFTTSNNKFQKKKQKTKWIQQIISGEVKLNFSGTNLDEIKGYGTKR